MASMPSHGVCDNRNEQIACFNAVNSLNCRSNILFCSICNQWLSAPIYSANVSVHICGKCYDDVFKRPNPVSRNKDLENFLLSYYYPCLHFKGGCGVVSKFQDIHQHEQNCKVITEAWKDLHCCLCKYKTPDRYSLVQHYKDVHHVRTTNAPHWYSNHAEVFFLQMQNSLYFVKCTLSTPRSLQICAALGNTAYYKVQVNCSCSESPYVVNVASNLNQLNSKNTNVTICYCGDKTFSLHSEAKIDFAFKCVDCCELSFVAQDHHKHILYEHSPRNGPLVNREALDETKPNYISVDGNIFRLMENSLSKLYCFAGNWGYSVHVSYEGVVKEKYELEFDEICKLPSQWDLLCIFRIECYDEMLIRKFRK